MGSVGVNNFNLSDSQMISRMDREFDNLNNKVNKALKGREGSIYDEENGIALEKYTLANIKKDYLQSLNDDLKNFGSNTAFYDPDTMIHIQYKDNSIKSFPDDFNENQKIPLSNIKAVIVNGGWGTAFAGPVTIYNMREQIDYGKYGYKNVKERYEDFNDFRVEFKK